LYKGWPIRAGVMADKRPSREVAQLVNEENRAAGAGQFLGAQKLSSRPDFSLGV